MGASLAVWLLHDLFLIGNVDDPESLDPVPSLSVGLALGFPLGNY